MEKSKLFSSIAHSIAKTIWNVLKKKSIAGILTTRHRSGQLRISTAGNERNIIRVVEKISQ